MKTKNKTGHSIFAAFVLLAFTLVPMRADQAIVPVESANTAGGNLFMFVRDTQGVYIYDANLFSAFPAGGGYLTGIAFRQDETGGTSRNETVELELRIGTTQLDSGQIQFPGRYDQVRSPSDQVVVPRSTIHIKTTYQPGTINPFSVKIPFETPYHYDPQNGNLVIDFRFFQGENITMDMAVGDDHRRLTGTLGMEMIGGFGGAPAALFQFTPVPEPRALYLAGVGLAISFFLWRRR